MNNRTRGTQSRWSIGGRSQPPPQPLEPQLSRWSTTGVRNSMWSSMDMMLGAGMVIFQRNTNKIVVVYETQKKYWFFPRGRKDIGESLETTALREGYEESGYRAEFMPLYNPTRQPPAPGPPEEGERLNTEPIAVTLMSWQPKRRRTAADGVDHGGEYLTTWYVGQILEDAVKDTGTGMWDEQHYESHLLTIEQAMRLIYGQERMVLEYAWAVYAATIKYTEEEEERARAAAMAAAAAAAANAEPDISKDVAGLSL